MVDKLLAHPQQNPYYQNVEEISLEACLELLNELFKFIGAWILKKVMAN